MLMRPQLRDVKEFVMYALRKSTIRRTGTMRLMPDKMSTLLRFVMMPKLETVMIVSRRDCLRPSLRFRNTMMAQQDLGDRPNQTQGIARMTTTSIV
jgi:hypothetical protein